MGSPILLDMILCSSKSSHTITMYTHSSHSFGHKGIPFRKLMSHSASSAALSKATNYASIVDLALMFLLHLMNYQIVGYLRFSEYPFERRLRTGGNESEMILPHYFPNSRVFIHLPGAENLAADHFSRSENPHEGDLEKKEIKETFPLETLGMIAFHDDVFTAKKPLISSRLAIMDPPRDIMVPITPLRKSLILVFIGRQFITMPMTWLSHVTHVNVKAKSRKKIKCLKMKFKYARSLTYGASILWDHSCLLEGTNTLSWPLTTCLNSDRGTHFYNDQFAKVMLKYGVTHHLSTAYHPQTSGQVEVSNHGLKHILERTVGKNQASWSDKLDDALWALHTAFKTPIGCTPYKLVYGKACHLPIELEHKAYWALKHCNFDLRTVGDHQKVQMNELNKLCDQAYENSLIYKEKTKKIHDSKIKNRVFNV
nr:reverse transcriptase domain-containing protein [Tanacetum cinerariifolium]